MVSILAAISEFERELILSRISEGANERHQVRPEAQIDQALERLAVDRATI